MSYFVNHVFDQYVVGFTYFTNSEIGIKINFDFISRQPPEQEADDLEVVVIE